MVYVNLGNGDKVKVSSTTTSSTTSSTSSSTSSSNTTSSIEDKAAYANQMAVKIEDLLSGSPSAGNVQQVERYFQQILRSGDQELINDFLDAASYSNVNVKNDDVTSIFGAYAKAKSDLSAGLFDGRDRRNVAISSTTNYLDQFQKASDDSDEFKSFAQVQKSDIENNLDYRTELNDPNNLFIASTAAGFGTGFVARKMALGSVEKKTFKAAQGAFNSTAEAGIDRYLTEEIKGNKKFIDSILSGNVDSLDKYGQEAARTLGGTVQSEAVNSLKQSRNVLLKDIGATSDFDFAKKLFGKSSDKITGFLPEDMDVSELKKLAKSDIISQLGLTGKGVQGKAESLLKQALSTDPASASADVKKVQDILSKTVQSGRQQVVDSLSDVNLTKIFDEKALEKADDILKNFAEKSTDDMYSAVKGAIKTGDISGAKKLLQKAVKQDNDKIVRSILSGEATGEGAIEGARGLFKNIKGSLSSLFSPKGATEILDDSALKTITSFSRNQVADVAKETSKGLIKTAGKKFLKWGLIGLGIGAAIWGISKLATGGDKEFANKLPA